MPKNNTCADNEKMSVSLLTPELEKRLQKFLTKQMRRILCLLLGCIMTNKELADQMGLSSSALSNILLRMKKSEIELLICEKREKSVLYSLTPVASEYTKKRLLTEQEEEARLFVINNDERADYNYGLNILKHLKCEHKNKFEKKLSDFLKIYGKQNGVDDTCEFQKFMDILRKLIINGKNEDYEELLKQIGSELLIMQVRECLDKFRYTGYLCVLDETAWKSAYQFVDDLFNGKGISIDFMKNCGELSAKEVADMADTLMEMVNDSQEAKMTKGDFLCAWESYFPGHEKLAYYIAEKYAVKYCAG